MESADPRAHVEARNAFEKLVGICMWVPGLAWLTGGMGTLMMLQRLLPPDRLEGLTRIYTRGQIAASGTSLEFVVDPEVDPKGVYMFAQNHVNLLDHCTFYNATPHFKQGVELAAHFKLPVYGWFMRQRGTIPVHKEKSPAEMLRLLEQGMREETARGHSLLVFPEGTRTRDGRVGPFRTGVLAIGYRIGLPIVPVTVTGMFEVLRKGEPYIVPGHKVTVYVDKPVPTAGVPAEEFPTLVEHVRQVVKRRVDDYYATRNARRHKPE
jgi:1-acyl-sn-glycerol-3-phosphate acyltransferase